MLYIAPLGGKICPIVAKFVQLWQNLSNCGKMYPIKKLLTQSKIDTFVPDGKKKQENPNIPQGSNPNLSDILPIVLISQPGYF